ncbi:MAG: GspH/FimT family pseudopilin [Deltaproteobacteria bacterium]|nr:GspH/FimT family pseudopilin [Deltaproteobacteria bacterium]
MTKGITLIELMVVVAIIAIAALFMAPAIGEWADNYRIRQAAREMVSDFQFAKLKAINRGKYCTVTFNISISGKNYDYIVFPDDDNDLELDLGTSEETNIYKKVIWSNEYRNIGFDTAKGGGDGITFTNNDNGEPSVAFNARGLPKNNSGGFGAGTVFLIHTKNNKGRQVVVSSAGRIRIDEY